MAGKKKWIDKMMSRPGAKGGLHRSTGTPMGEKIPAQRLAEAASGALGPRAKKQAQAAKNMKKG